jgi:arylsulfatase A-like enzyme
MRHRWLIGALICSLLAMPAHSAELVGGELSGSGLNVPEVYNVLWIIADDVGRQNLPDLYPEGDAAYPRTPNIKAIADDGLVFRTFYGSQLCGPTRAEMMSSTWGFRHAVFLPSGRNFRIQEWTLPRVIEHALPDVYRMAQFGKLGLWDDNDGVHAVYWSYAAGSYGFERFYGAMGASVLDYCESAPAACDGVGYTRTEMNATGITFPEITYTETAVSDPGIYPPARTTTDTLAWIAEVEAADASQRWLAIASYHLAHSPMHTPPGGVCGAGEDCYKEMIEELDDEIGLLLAGVDCTNTLIIFMGDNGGLYQPVGHGKDTLYESGVALPAVFGCGPVRPSATIQTGNYSVVDIMPTLLDLAGAKKKWPATRANAPDVDSSYDGSTLDIDGISMKQVLLGLASPEEHTYLLAYDKLDERCIRNDGYKYCDIDGTTALYVVPADGTDEGADLCTGNCPTDLGGADLAAYTALSTELARLEATEP